MKYLYGARLIGGLLLLLGGCGKTVRHCAPGDSWAVREHEARVGDIPVSMDFHLKKRAMYEGQAEVFYTTQQSPNEVTSFYQKSMPQQGWEQRCLTNGLPRILVFEKGYRTTIVVLSSRGGKTIVKTYVCN